MMTVVMRKAVKSDAENIVELLSGANAWPGFEHQGSMVDHWEWRYGRNPNGFTNEIIATVEGRALSHAASQPTELRIGRTVRLCSQLSDLYTDPDSRGQGLMEKVMSELFAKDAKDGIELEFAFPSLIGYDLTTKAGFEEMPVRMGQYEMITDPGRFFSNVRFGALKKVAYRGMRMVKGRTILTQNEVEVTEVTAFPSDIATLTEEFEQNFDLILRRGEKYLRWRYEQPDGGLFRILIARRNGSTCGYIVLRPYLVSGQRYMDVVDLVASPNDRSSLTALIEGGVDICHKEEANMLQIWLPTDHPFLAELGRMGFLLRQPVPGERRMRLVCRPLSADPTLVADLEGVVRYHLVLGDSDWV